MTEERIKELCPKAENITITDDGTVSMKVGLFAQSVGTRYNENNPRDWEGAVLNLYRDLQGMNRQVERQEREAAGL